MGFQVKIVGDFCNIRCAYCRNRDFDRTDKAVMSVETLERFIAFLNTVPQQEIRAYWHGGEPLLAGKDFFKHIVRIEKQYPEKTWKNGVQTNSTLIDEDWAKFFVENNFHIGVSIDGNERVHNIDRIDASGRGTYKNAMRGVNILREHGIRPGVICTVTKKTVKYAEEIFLGLVNSGFKSICFNVFYNTASENKGDEYALTEKEWFNFLKEVFDLWYALDDRSISVRELDAILAWTAGRSASECSFRGSCSQWFAVDYTGDIYPCERFGRKVHFGSIQSVENYQNLIASPILLDWRNEIRILPSKCKSCNFLSLCYNGCCSHRRADSEGVPLYTYCESRLELFDYIKNKLNFTFGGRNGN
ncbi:MAG: radical SAM protein [Candidatus Parcubacteria bacterium]|nr:radical SAM protein [Candidatus Parcubacteria bacterium]